MAWIESHQSLGTNRKMLKLARLLGIDKVAAVGHLHFLWWFGLDNARKDGRLPGADAAVVADAACWPDDADAFVDALVQTGFLNRRKGTRRNDTSQTLFIHNWDHYAGRLEELRAKNAARQRAFRKRTATEPITVTLPSRNASCSRNVTGLPDPTGPNQTPTTTTALADADFARLQTHYEQAYGIALAPTPANVLTELAEESSLDDVLDAITEAARCRKSDPRYIAAIVRRWQVEGRQPTKGTKHGEVRRDDGEAKLEQWAIENWQLLRFTSQADAKRIVLGSG